MVARNCDGKVPACPEGLDVAELEVHAALVLARAIIANVRELMERQAFNLALDEIWGAVRSANRCIDADAPWKLRKTDPERMNAVLYVLMEAIRHIAIVTQPFMPDSCARILDQLSVAPDARNFEHLLDGNALTPGTPMPKPEPVFPRFVEDEAAAEA
jgi:methionyl-tRNA synthetase